MGNRNNVLRMADRLPITEYTAVYLQYLKNYMKPGYPRIL